mgnify:CR=1 FL=1
MRARASSLPLELSSAEEVDAPGTAAQRARRPLELLDPDEVRREEDGREGDAVVDLRDGHGRDVVRLVACEREREAWRADGSARARRQDEVLVVDCGWESVRGAGRMGRRRSRGGRLNGLGARRYRETKRNSTHRARCRRSRRRTPPRGRRRAGTRRGWVRALSGARAPSGRGTRACGRGRLRDV